MVGCLIIVYYLYYSIRLSINLILLEFYFTGDASKTSECLLVIGSGDVGNYHSF